VGFNFFIVDDNNSGHSAGGLKTTSEIMCVERLHNAFGLR
jgi:hypothetical protein